MLKTIDKNGLGTIKNILMRVLDLINNPEISAREITELIELDPTMSAKVLKLANSSLYGSGKDINDIKGAIVRIGFDNVKEIVVSQSIFDFYNLNGDFKTFSGKKLWQHSLEVALFSKYLYRREFKKQGNDAYSAGLLHDIGIIIESQAIENSFKDCLKTARKLENDLFQVENYILGFNHSDIGMEFGKLWFFPEEIKSVIKNHHVPNNSSKHEKLVKTIFLAEFITADEEDIFTDIYQDENREMFKKITEDYKISEEAIDLIKEQVCSDIENYQKEGLF